MITLKARGKINLTMDVLNKRQDGFHEVETIMSPISLADVITLGKLPGGKLELSCSQASLDVEDNLVLKAARLLQKKTPHQGVKITLKKNIPVAAGLAGGSSDAASALKGLNSLWDLQLKEEDLLNLAGQLGSDVPFCYLEKTAIARGRGELITPLPKPPIFWVLLAIPPGLSISTAFVYQNLKLADIINRPQAKEFLNCFYEADLYGMAGYMVNVLESVVLPRYPRVKELKKEMKKLTPCGLMSGSGPTVFGLFIEEEQALAAEKVIKNKGYRTFLSSTVLE